MAGECIVDGMTLRDWFAGQALVAILNVNQDGGDNEKAAMLAYELADAMLAERAK